MLGKGLESLIPPHQSSDEHDAGRASQNQSPAGKQVSNGTSKHGSGQAQSDDDRNDGRDVSLPAEPPRSPAHLTGHHGHLAVGAGAAIDATDGEPQPAILSFDFTDEPPNVREEIDMVATPAVAPALSDIKKSVPATKKESKEELIPHDHVFHIEVGKIRPNPNQPRRNFNETALWELAKSIREFGFLQPLVVTRAHKSTEDGVDVEYELIAGERRLMAAKLLGLEYVPAIIREVDLEREKLELAIIENLQREELNPVERARAFQRLQEEFRLTQREIAAKLGKSRETVANTVRLLDLPMYIQEALEKGQITESHGRFLLQIGEPAAQKKLFDDILSQGLTTRDVKVRVQSAKPHKQRAREGLSPELKMLEEKLTMELGAPVKIEQNANTGKIVITFYSEEELQNILRRFGGGEDRI